MRPFLAGLGEHVLASCRPADPGPVLQVRRWQANLPVSRETINVGFSCAAITLASCDERSGTARRSTARSGSLHNLASPSVSALSQPELATAAVALALVAGPLGEPAFLLTRRAVASPSARRPVRVARRAYRRRRGRRPQPPRELREELGCRIGADLRAGSARRLCHALGLRDHPGRAVGP